MKTFTAKNCTVMISGATEDYHTPMKGCSNSTYRKSSIHFHNVEAFKKDLTSHAQYYHPNLAFVCWDMMEILEETT